MSLRICCAKLKVRSDGNHHGPRVGSKTWSMPAFARRTSPEDSRSCGRSGRPSRSRSRRCPLQHVGIVPHLLDCLLAVGLEDSHRPAVLTPWLWRNSMISRTCFASCHARSAPGAWGRCHRRFAVRRDASRSRLEPRLQISRPVS
jgi:hypothetical protein